MPQNINDPVIRANLEEGITWSVPTLKHLLNNAQMIVEPKAKRTFVRLPSRIALHAHPHTQPPLPKWNQPDPTQSNAIPTPSNTIVLALAFFRQPSDFLTILIGKTRDPYLSTNPGPSPAICVTSD